MEFRARLGRWRIDFDRVSCLVVRVGVACRRRYEVKQDKTFAIFPIRQEGNC
jgi:hypothetical protein